MESNACLLMLMVCSCGLAASVAIVVAEVSAGSVGVVAARIESITAG